MKSRSVVIYIGEAKMNFYSWKFITDGFLKSGASMYIGAPLRSAITIAVNDEGKWGVEQARWNFLGRKVNEKLVKKKFDLKKYVAEHLDLGEKLFQLCDEILTSDNKKAENEIFAAWFIKVWPLIVDLNRLGLAAVVSDFEHAYLSKSLIDILEKHLADTTEVQSYLSTLISADFPDLNWQERLEFLALLKKYKTIEKLAASTDLAAHINKYCWINFGYIGPIWTKKDFIARARETLLKPSTLSQQYKQHKLHFSNLIKEQNKIEIELNLNKSERYLFKAARTFMFVKAYRLNVRHKVQYASEIIFEELCKRYKLSIDSFRYAQRNEILDFLKGKKISMRQIAKRRNGIVEITENGKQKLISLTKAKSFLKRVLIPEMITATDTVNGQVAFIGKIQGRAKIVYNTMDMAKVHKGDILFAVTTTPDLLPAMNKAAAFVTDQGGITSHAAIVARELKKPCIIGTKIGTKIFKDGDMIEVDANRGIVKKI